MGGAGRGVVFIDTTALAVCDSSATLVQHLRKERKQIRDCICSSVCEHCNVRKLLGTEHECVHRHAVPAMAEVHSIERERFVSIDVSYSSSCVSLSPTPSTSFIR
jgi:hypothetical protein